jgi:hypothetical protein
MVVALDTGHPGGMAGDQTVISARFTGAFGCCGCCFLAGGLLDSGFEAIAPLVALGFAKDLRVGHGDIFSRGYDSFGRRGAGFGDYLRGRRDQMAAFADSAQRYKPARDETVTSSGGVSAETETQSIRSGCGRR